MDERLVRWLMTPTKAELPLEDLLQRDEWRQRAACRGADPALFFPRHGDGRPDAGLAYCQRCPVTAECLAAALEGGDRTAGVWGGTTGRERRQMRRGVA